MLYFEAYKFQHARESDDSLPVVLYRQRIFAIEWQYEN